MKLCIIASHLFSGGFTTSMLNMIHLLKKQGVGITLLFLEPDQHQLPLDCIDGVPILPVKYQKHHAYDLLTRLEIKKRAGKCNALLEQSNHAENETEKKKYIQKYMQTGILNRVFATFEEMDLRGFDCVISWEELLCNDFLAYKVKAKKKIGYIHPDYFQSGYDRECDLPVLKNLDHIAAVSEITAEHLKQTFPEYAEKVVCIPNVLDTERILSDAAEDIPVFKKSSFDIVTACRLSIETKGLDRLLKTVEKLEKDGVSFEWYVLGEGDGRQWMEETIQQKELHHVHLMGQKNNPYPFIKKADLFCLLSNYEGKPMAVEEALFLNVPVLITNYASAHEQVNEKEGFVVPMDDDAVYQKMKEIISCPGILEGIKEYLSGESKERFTDTRAFIKAVEE